MTAENEYWLTQRRLIQPFFHKEKIKSIVALIEMEVDQFFNKLVVKSGQKKKKLIFTPL
jgi:cytochrome P450